MSRNVGFYELERIISVQVPDLNGYNYNKMIVRLITMTFTGRRMRPSEQTLQETWITIESHIIATRVLLKRKVESDLQSDNGLATA